MGRWAQRTRGGGGRTVQVIGATFTVSFFDGSSANLDYSTPIDVSPLVAANFRSFPSGVVATSIDNLAPGSAGINFPGFHPADTFIRYTGATTGFESPWQANY